MCGPLSIINFGKFSVNITSKISSAAFSISFASGIPITLMLLFVFVSLFLDILFVYFFIFARNLKSFFDISSSSLISFSALVTTFKLSQLEFVSLGNVVLGL